MFDRNKRVLAEMNIFFWRPGYFYFIFFILNMCFRFLTADVDFPADAIVCSFVCLLPSSRKRRL